LIVIFGFGVKPFFVDYRKEASEHNFISASELTPPLLSQFIPRMKKILDIGFLE
jgi:hypothetical protein